MKNIAIICKRELCNYFETPVAYVFMVVFLLLCGLFTFYLGHFYEAGQANLHAFFIWHPWIYLFLTPAISMRLWSEERRSGTIELLMTLAIKPFEAVLGKYFAAWIFASIALLLTFPIWLTVNYLGSPDNGEIFTGYIASILVAGGFLAIGSCMSSLTNNQVIAFVLSLVVCFLFNVSGVTMVLNFFETIGFSQAMLDTVSSLSFLTQFIEISKGVINLANLVFFSSIIVFWLFINILVIKKRR